MSNNTALVLLAAMFLALLTSGAYFNGKKDTEKFKACVENGGSWTTEGWRGPECIRFQHGVRG